MRTYFIAHNHTGKLGTGTDTDPFNGKFFDKAIQAIKLGTPDAYEQVSIKIREGRFETSGIAPGNNWSIEGAGIGLTVIALIDVLNLGFHHPDNYIISTPWSAANGGLPWVNSFTLKNLTLDCNFEHQSARGMQSVKFGGVHVQYTEATVEDVEVVNFGSNGLDLATSEAWGIYLVSYSSELPKDKTTFARIKNCVVRDQKQFNGRGYCTGINITTIQTQAGGDRIPWGSRQSQAAVVEGCRCIGLDGHGYGAANSENVLFLNNEAVGCKTFFNGDTGQNRNISFAANRAIACNQGIHFGNPGSGEFSDFRIIGNRFELTGPWLNEKLNPTKTEYSYGVRLSGRTKAAVIVGNEFVSLYGPKRFGDGMYGIGLDALDGDVRVANKFSGIGDPTIVNPPVYL